jgi:hypothetical protein
MVYRIDLVWKSYSIDIEYRANYVVLILYTNWYFLKALEGKEIISATLRHIAELVSSSKFQLINWNTLCNNAFYQLFKQFPLSTVWLPSWHLSHDICTACAWSWGLNDSSLKRRARVRQAWHLEIRSIAIFDRRGYRVTELHGATKYQPLLSGEKSIRIGVLAINYMYSWRSFIAGPTISSSRMNLMMVKSFERSVTTRNMICHNVDSGRSLNSTSQTEPTQKWASFFFIPKVW